MIANDSTAGLSGLRIRELSQGMLRLQTVLSSRGCSVKAVCEALEVDARLCAHVLETANAQRTPRDPEVKSIAQAVCALGLSSLGMIAMRGAALLAFEDVRSPDGFDVERFWRHSSLSAHIAHEFSGRMPARVSNLSADQLYASVLLHDIGQLVLLATFGKRYADLHARVERGQDGSRMEQEHFGVNHAAIGAMVATAWGLPEPVPAGIGLHHQSECTGDAAELARIIRTADALAHAVASSPGSTPAELVSVCVDPPRSLQASSLTEVAHAAIKWFVDHERARFAGQGR
jgi:HD-like signal output (HDOD) protein